MFGFNFPPRGWAFCDGQPAADLAEHRALLPARHDLRRRRQVDLRAAEPAGQRPDAPRPGARAEPALPRRAGRLGDRHADRV
nr:phage tail protein [Nocardioides convexus]